MNSISQGWEDHGYWTEEEADHFIAVGYKDKIIAVFNQTVATTEAMDAVCERHQGQLALEKVVRK
jgi:hypothetical protein